jgi:hypothetical protein
MQNNYTEYSVPAFGNVQSYNFDAATKENFNIYQELTEIAEEIEKCRLRNC